MRSLQSITLLIVAVVVSLGMADEPLTEPPITDSDRGHWAFEPLRRPMPPVVQNASWCRTAIDRFILARLEEAGLDAMDYEKRWGRYRIRLQPSDFEKNRAILSEIIAEAYANTQKE